MPSRLGQPEEVLPGSTAECELQCDAIKSAKLAKCSTDYPIQQDYEAHSACVKLVLDDYAKCRSACGGGVGTGALLAGAAVLAFLVWG